MRISRLRTRIILFFVAMFVVMEVCGFALLNASSSRNATVEIEGELNVGQRILARLVRQKAQFLSQGAHVLAGYSTFLEAVATGDTATLTATLANLQRIRAKSILYV